MDNNFPFFIIFSAMRRYSALDESLVVKRTGIIHCSKENKTIDNWNLKGEAEKIYNAILEGVPDAIFNSYCIYTIDFIKNLTFEYMASTKSYRISQKTCSLIHFFMKMQFWWRRRANIQ